MKKTNSKGFTLVELTIVILALSVVSTLLLFPFKENINIARDTTRKSNLNIMANVIRLDRISNKKEGYDGSKNELINIFNQTLKVVPTIESDKHYFYGYSAKKDDFFVSVCSESRQIIFTEGTENAKEAVSKVFPEEACNDKKTPFRERYSPLNPQSSSDNLDSYIIYKIF